MKKIYFDNASTTRVRPEVADIVLKVMEEDYANPSSVHCFGLEAEKYIREASCRIAKTLRVDPGEIIFTSGATEGNNTAIFGIAKRRKRLGRHIVSSRIEHPSVLNPLKKLEKEGFEVTYLDVDNSGKISAEKVSSAIRDDTILLSLMWVNNEIGSVLDIPAIVKKVKNRNPSIYIHTDAVQAYGKFRLRPSEALVDVMCVSGHKFHAPKGIGFMYVADKVLMEPLILGGGQQHDRRSGTENVPGIAGIGLAASLYYDERDEITSRMLDIKKKLTERLLAMDFVTVNSSCGLEGAPHIVSASFEGIRAEVLLHALEEKNIYVSSGSACSSNHPGISETLKAIGLKNKLLDCTLRFSFGIYNTVEEANYVADILEKLCPELRRYSRH